MKAVLVKEAGGPEVLQVVEVPKPTVKEVGPWSRCKDLGSTIARFLLVKDYRPPFNFHGF